MRSMAFAAMAALFLSGPAQAAPFPPKNQPMKPLADAKPLAAWTVFCEANPSECAVDAAQPAAIALTPASWKLIEATNLKVNASITPLSDMDHWGKADVWNLAEDGKGDCEEYPLVKRRMLVEKGLPRRAMRMTVVIDEKGEGHAVLVLVTDRGDFVLDNKEKAVLAWHRTGYVFIKRESQEKVGWTSLGGVTGPETGKAMH
jgi:predicted transglutaminase-like cysteine proteinase